MGLFMFLGALVLIPFAGAAVYKNRKRDNRPSFGIQLIAGAILLLVGVPAVVCVVQGVAGVLGIAYNGGRAGTGGLGIVLLAAGVALGYLAYWLIRWVERNFAVNGNPSA